MMFEGVAVASRLGHMGRDLVSRVGVPTKMTLTTTTTLPLPSHEDAWKRQQSENQEMHLPQTLNSPAP